MDDTSALGKSSNPSLVLWYVRPIMRFTSDLIMVLPNGIENRYTTPNATVVGFNIDVAKWHGRPDSGDDG